MSLFSELKRRNVFRVAIAYLAAAWLITEVTGTIFPLFGYGDAPARIAVILLAIAFPLFLVFSWVYEITPEGLKLEKDVIRDKSITPKTGKRIDRLIIVLLAAAVGYFAFDKFVLEPIRDEAMVKRTVEQARSGLLVDSIGDQSIAVLPFVNMSNDPANEYFSDGVSEELMNALAKVQELKVTGRSSSFAFKGGDRDLREIGEILGVKHILEGSVRKSRDSVRITAQLIQAETGFQLWSESYDRQLTDIFAVQDEITEAILAHLKKELLKGEYGFSANTRADARAYELYLLARQRIYERNRASLESAVDLLEEAIGISPEHAPSYAQLAIAKMLLWEGNYGDLTWEEAVGTAQVHFETGYAIDPESAEVLAAMGLFNMGPPGPNPDLAVEQFRKALAINPNLSDAGNWLSIQLQWLGHFQEQLELLESIHDRDPLYMPALHELVELYLVMGMNDKAFEVLDHVKPELRFNPIWLRILGQAQWLTGKWAEANDSFRESHDLDQGRWNYAHQYWFSQLLTGTSQYEDCLDLLDKRFCLIALGRLGRAGEAQIIGNENLNTRRNPDALFRFYLENGEFENFVDLFEFRWRDLDAFTDQLPLNQWGALTEAFIAEAYRGVGQNENFSAALALAKTRNEALESQGANNSRFSLSRAYVAVLDGDSEAALDYLEMSANQGGLLNLTSPTAWPAFRVLDDNPRFISLKVKMLERINDERAKMGLNPIELQN